MAQFVKLIDKAIGEGVKGVTAVTRLNKFQYNITKPCELINFVENQVDDVTREVIGNSVNTEKDVIKIIKLKEIYESFEAVADRCEDVANALETIVVKNQ